MKKFKISFFLKSPEYKEIYRKLINIFHSNDFNEIEVYAKDQDTINFLNRFIERKINFINFNTFRKNIVVDNILEKTVNYEKKYSISFNNIISQDRGLGQGYLFNTTKVPHIFKSGFSYERKLLEVIKEIKLYV